MALIVEERVYYAIMSSGNTEEGEWFSYEISFYLYGIKGSNYSEGWDLNVQSY